MTTPFPHVFRITIQPAVEGGHPVLVQQTTAGLLLPMLYAGNLAAGLGDRLGPVGREEVSRALGDELFQGVPRVRDVLVQAIERCRGEWLHVQLYLEDPELRSLPWQRLHAPVDGEWTPLALSPSCPLSMYLPSRSDRLFPPIGRSDLKALVFVANPEGTARYRLDDFDADLTARWVSAALAPIEQNVCVMDKNRGPAATLELLCERLVALRPTLLHLVSHGSYRSDTREPFLFLADDNRQVVPVPATKVVGQLQKLHPRALPHLVFLCACEGATPRAERGLGGLAQRLVRDVGIRVVVAMTEKVSIQTANELAELFYARLGEHGVPDLALSEACSVLAQRPDVAVPVPAVFTRLEGVGLFNAGTIPTRREQELAARVEELEKAREQAEKARK
jgi:hypothetical protein